MIGNGEKNDHGYFPDETGCVEIGVKAKLCAPINDDQKRTPGQDRCLTAERRMA
jgi:hypothetical protein